MEEFEVLSGGIRLMQGDNLFRLGTDSMLLADFCLPLRKRNILDLGCGGGALGLLLCASDSQCHICGVELQREAYLLAQQNISINGLEDRFQLVLEDYRSFSPKAKFDMVISNPPYFPVGSGFVSTSKVMEIARTECCGTLSDLCGTAKRCLNFGGSLCLVHRAERLGDVIYAMKQENIQPIRLQFVRHSPKSEVSLLLIEGRLGGRSGLQLLPELVLHRADGTPTEEYQRIYHLV